MGFRVTKEGTVAAPKIITSSGSAEQDAAALQCVQFWRYRHVSKDGVPLEMPVEVPWVADIAWTPTIPPALTRQLRRCAEALRVKLSGFSPAYNATEYAITYDEHYRAATITVTRSSGDVALDKAGADCVMSPEEPRELVVIGGKVNMLQQKTFPARITWKD